MTNYDVAQGDTLRREPDRDDKSPFTDIFWGFFGLIFFIVFFVFPIVIIVGGIFLGIFMICKSSRGSPQPPVPVQTIAINGVGQPIGLQNPQNQQQHPHHPQYQQQTSTYQQQTYQPTHQQYGGYQQLNDTP